MAYHQQKSPAGFLPARLLKGRCQWATKLLAAKMNELLRAARQLAKAKHLRVACSSAAIIARSVYLRSAAQLYTIRPATIGCSCVFLYLKRWGMLHAPLGSSVRMPPACGANGQAFAVLCVADYSWLGASNKRVLQMSL